MTTTTTTKHTVYLFFYYARTLCVFATETRNAIYKRRANLWIYPRATLNSNPTTGENLRTGGLVSHNYIMFHIKEIENVVTPIIMVITPVQVNFVTSC